MVGADQFVSSTNTYKYDTNHIIMIDLSCRFSNTLQHSHTRMHDDDSKLFHIFQFQKRLHPTSWNQQISKRLKTLNKHKHCQMVPDPMLLPMKKFSVYIVGTIQITPNNQEFSRIMSYPGQNCWPFLYKSSETATNRRKIISPLNNKTITLYSHSVAF